MPKSRPKAAPRLIVQKTTKPSSRKRPAPVTLQRSVKPKTKHARIIGMLQSPAGATLARMMSATNWQKHSVRGFLAGVVRKKLCLNLVSELTDKGRVYRIKNGNVSAASANRVNSAV
jgi:Protein of unknown function (DUF3489)